MLQAYNRHDALMTASDSVPLYDFDGRYAMHSFLSRAKAGSIFTLWGNPLELTAKKEYRRMKSESVDTITRRNATWTFTPTYTIRFGSEDYLELGLPLQYLDTNIDAATKNSKTRWNLLPSASLRKNLGPSFTLRLNFYKLVENAASSFYSSFPVRITTAPCSKCFPKCFSPEAIMCRAD